MKGQGTKLGSIKDLTGKRFQKLIAQWPVGFNRGYNCLWLCLCDCGKTTIRCSGDLTRNRASGGTCGCDRRRFRPLQMPGQSYTFIDRKTGVEDIGILPAKYGDTNDFVYWAKKSNCKNGGNWSSKKFVNARAHLQLIGANKRGTISRMRWLITSSRRAAKSWGGEPIKTSPADMIRQWEEQKGNCKACAKPLMGLRRPDLRHITHDDTVYDHDHDTGEGRGFIHSYCNLAEGYTKKMTDEEFLNFVRYFRPGLLESGSSFFGSLGL